METWMMPLLMLTLPMVMSAGAALPMSDNAALQTKTISCLFQCQCLPMMPMSADDASLDTDDDDADFRQCLCQPCLW